MSNQKSLERINQVAAAAQKVVDAYKKFSDAYVRFGSNAAITIIDKAEYDERTQELRELLKQ